MSASDYPRGGDGPRGLTLQQAIAEAQRCLLCHDAPCSTSCPGATDPGKFVRQIRFYNFKGAARTVLGNNPLGEVCAYVCPTDETCVKACTRTEIDRPIDIDGLQRFAAEYGRAHGVEVYRRGEDQGKRVAVVGAGPAGLAAASRLAGYGYDVTIFEARSKAGGMLRYGVPEGRLPEAVLDRELSDIVEQSIKLNCGQAIDGNDGVLALLKDGFSAVFVAPGLWRPYSLDLPGMDADGVTTAIEFLELCREDAEAAAALVKDRNIAIVGGGSVAMDVAHSAYVLGAGRVYAISLESMTELPANEKEFHTALEEGVFFKPQCQLTEVLAADGKVSGCKGVEVEWIDPEADLVPSNARPIEGTSWQLSVGAVVVAIGQGATSTAGTILASLDKDGSLVRVDERLATSAQGVYAGGDIVRGPATVVGAVGDGKQAAEAIHEFLSGADKEVTS